MKVVNSSKIIFYLKKNILESIQEQKEFDVDFWYTKDDLELSLIELFKAKIITIKDMQKLGINSNIIDSAVVKRWFSLEEFTSILAISDDHLKALAIIGRIYAEKTDRSGYPQSKHLISVSNGVDTLEEKVVGLLHDVVEDGYLTLTSLHLFKIKGRVIKAIKILTRDKEIHSTYDSYVRNQILPSKSLTVLKVKSKDMKNNQSPERVLELPTLEQQQKALNKYKPYIPLLDERIYTLTLKKKEER